MKAIIYIKREKDRVFVSNSKAFDDNVSSTYINHPLSGENQVEKCIEGFKSYFNVTENVKIVDLDNQGFIRKIINWFLRLNKKLW